MDSALVEVGKIPKGKPYFRILLGGLLAYGFVFIVHSLVFYKLYSDGIHHAVSGNEELSSDLHNGNVFLYLARLFLRHTCHALSQIGISILELSFTFYDIAAFVVLLLAPLGLFVYKQNGWTWMYLTVSMLFWIVVINLMAV